MKLSKMKSFILKVIILIMLILNFPINSDATYSDYNANNWDVFKSRSKEQIGAQFSKAINAGDTYRNWDANTYYKKRPSLTNPYSEGELKDDTLKAMTAMTNYYRWLEGVSPIKLATGSSELQAGAVTRKWQFAHNISITNKPSDMSDEFWYKGANVYHNILALGYSPRGAITGWLDEGYNLRNSSWDTIGHRTALLSSSVSELKFGYAGSIAIGLITGSDNVTDLPYTAFPVPGYMPNNILYSQTSAWHIELNSDIIKIKDSSKVKVVVTNLKTNESYECTSQNGKLSGYYILTFVQPDAETKKYYSSGEKFKVEVTGLTEIATDKDITLTYTTEFFDVSNYATTTRAVEVKMEGGWESIRLGPQNATTDRLKKIGKILPMTVKVETEAGRIATVKIKGEWKLDEANACWTAMVDKSSFPSFLTDPDGLLNSIKINYKVGNSYVNRYFQTSNSQPSIGENINFRMWTYMLGTDIYEVYQINNRNEVKQRFKENRDTVKEEYGWYMFNLNSVKATDAGTYIGIYYANNSFDTEAYIAGMVDLDVKSVPFVDVKRSDWFYNAVEYVYTNNIIKGYNATTFAPNDQLTRGMMVTILHRMEGSPAVSGNTKFSDVQNSKYYYYNAVKWASDKGIVSGYDNGKFGPDDNITREQLAVILCKYAKYKGKNTTQTNDLSAFSDRSKVSKYALAQMKWAVGSGVITGNKDKTLKPQGNATRAEVSAMLEKYCQRIGR